jgi:hypothetical protein
MKEFLDLFRAVAENKENVKTIKRGITKALTTMTAVQKWLAKVPEDKFNKSMEAISVHARENLANMVRNGKINEAFLEKVHRIRMMVPSDVTREFERLLNAYYDEYGDKAK